MGKKKQFKDDGITEDFDAESKEIDEAEAAPGLLDDAGSDAFAEAPSEDAPSEEAPEIKEEPAVAPAMNAGADEGLAPKSTDEKAELAASEHTPAELEPSQSETPNVEPAIEAKDAQPAAEDAAQAEDDQIKKPSLGSQENTATGSDTETAAKSGAASEESAVPAAAEPAAFGDLQHDVSELAEHLGGEAIDEMKKAGDALTPAVSALHGIEAKLEHLGDEAKARFVHAKTMLVHAMAALERLFHRG